MIVIRIFSPLPLTDRRDGQDIIDLWATHIPELLPDCYGNWEPVDRKFDLRSVESILDHWAWPFLMHKKSPRMDSSVFMRKGGWQRLHAVFSLDSVFGLTTQDHLLDFLAAASSRLKADFACLHLATEEELQLGKANRTTSSLDKDGKKLLFLPRSGDLQRRIPDLYWATVLGAPYLNMFGRERVFSIPAYATVPLSAEGALLQLTEKLADVEEDHQSFCQIRSDVKDHLGAEAFFELTRETPNSYRTPEFTFFGTEV